MQFSGSYGKFLVLNKVSKEYWTPTVENTNSRFDREELI
jgi:hypothetical protein